MLQSVLSLSVSTVYTRNKVFQTDRSVKYYFVGAPSPRGGKYVQDRLNGSVAHKKKSGRQVALTNAGKLFYRSHVELVAITGLYYK